MTRILATQTVNKVDKEVTLKGWVNTRRDMGKIAFLDLRDRSGLIQVVLVPSELPAKAKKLVDKIRPEFVLEITGIVQKRGEKQINENLPTGEVEVLAKDIQVLAEAETLPFELGSKQNLDVYLDYLPLNMRDVKNRSIFKVASEIISGFREYLTDQDFTEIQSPKITAGSTEGGANVFKVDYYKGKAFLAQSPQFYKQIMVGVYERVFTVGTVFRAEKHATSRHLSEYVSLDFEFGFIKDHTDVMKMIQETVRAICNRMKKECELEFKRWDAEIAEVPKEIPILKLTEAQEILDKEYKQDCVGEPDLEPEHEKLLCKWSMKKHNSDFVFITHYPTKKRPMYTMPDDENPKETKSFDLLFRGVEIVTGGQRINDYNQLVENIKKWGLDPKDFDFYLQAFKYGMPPEGGIAVGLERLTYRFLNIENIKQATLFPRDINRIDERLSKQ